LGGGPEYALEGSVFIAGAALQWLRDSLGVIADSAESEALAQSLSDCGGVYFVPAFVGLGAPHWDSDVRGTIVGLSRGSGRAHLVRAALESIALQSSDLIHAMEKDSGEAIKKLRVDGGAAVNNFLLQYQADILGVEVHRPEMTETTAFGAACLAGIGSGLYAGKNDVQRVWTLARRFTPAISSEKRKRLIAGWKKALGAAAVYRPPITEAAD
jgi:glycerol kinase